MTKPFDSERETRVLLEDVRSELRVVAEGHTNIVKHLDKVEEKLEQHDHRFDRIEGRLGRIDGRLDRVEGRLGHVEGQLDQLQNQVSAVFTNHESRLKTLEAE